MHQLVMHSEISSLLFITIK